VILELIGRVKTRPSGGRWRVTAAIVLLASVSTFPQDDLAHSRTAFFAKLVAAAVQRANLPVRYDGRYVRIPYPGGDVPADTGVCTDEVIRVYRQVGIDLQKEVHEDMVRNFGAYPKQWGLLRPDPNIDHRRVPNLAAFFRRKGEILPISAADGDYAPGELVTWDLGGGVPHIGIVVNRHSSTEKRYLLLHNIGAGPKIEDVLFRWKITGHFHYYGPKRAD
jgi:hypothetical protein